MPTLTKQAMGGEQTDGPFPRLGNWHMIYSFIYIQDGAARGQPCPPWRTVGKVDVARRSVNPNFCLSVDLLARLAELDDGGGMQLQVVDNEQRVLWRDGLCGLKIVGRAFKVPQRLVRECPAARTQPPPHTERHTRTHTQATVRPLPLMNSSNHELNL